MAKPKFSVNSNLGNQSKTPEQLRREFYLFEVVSLLDLVPSEHNFYSMDMDSIRDLAEDIKVNGLLNPPLIHPGTPNSKRGIIDGERRYRALKLLYEEGHEEHLLVMCQVKRLDTPLDAEMLTISANMHTRILTEADKLEQSRRIREICDKLRAEGKITSGRTREYAAQMLGVSSAQIAIYDKINKNLDPELKPLIKTGDMTIGEASVMASMPAEKQQAVVEEYRATGDEAVKDAVRAEKSKKVMEGKQGIVADLLELIEAIDSNQVPAIAKIRKVCVAAVKALESKCST